MKLHPGMENLVEDVSHLVSLPEIYYQLEAALALPRTSTQDVCRILSVDVDLSARLLRLANSAFYGFPAKIESLHRALAAIGTRQLQELVLATSVLRLFTRLPLGAVSMRSFWQHSLFTGVLARCMAQQLREPNSERFYLGGLLHDIGRLVMYLKLPDLMHRLLLMSAQEQCLLDELEREHIGFDHADVGGYLLRHWRLPLSLSEPVTYHHQPEAAAEYRLEAAVIHMAECYAHQQDYAGRVNAVLPDVHAAARQRVGLNDAELLLCLADADAQFAAVTAIFFPQGSPA